MAEPGRFGRASAVLAATRIGRYGELELLGEERAWRLSSAITGPVLRPDYVRKLRDIIGGSLGVIVPYRHEVLRMRDVRAYARGTVPVLHTVTSAPLAEADPEHVAEMLRDLGTGLLVLEGAPAKMDGFAREVVRAGGPATLRVRIPDAPLSSKRYFRKLYESLAEGTSLEEAARPFRFDDERGLEAELFLGDEVPEIPVFPAGHRPEIVVAHPVQGSAGKPRVGAREQAFAGEPDEVEEKAESARESRGTEEVDGEETKSAVEPEGDDGGGAESLQPDEKEEVPRPNGGKKRRPPVEKEEGDGGGPAPRVLNANFAEPGAADVLPPRAALGAGREYELRVDVGPPWDPEKTLVKGKKTFPERHLPPTDEGWPIQVVLISEHFTPGTVTGEIFLPARAGRSFPVVDGVRAGRPGPLALRVTAPASVDEGSGEALGRLCMYFGSNLVQSAIVRVGVRAAPGETLERDNRIEVDYVLSADLDLDAFATRTLLVDGREEAVPVSLSLALNGDGAGGHRIILKDAPDAVPAWLPFDPGEARTVLDGVRARLMEVFFRRDPGSYRVDEAVPGLDARNGKDRDQFQMDLFRLASEGSRLYEMVATNLRPKGMDARTWEWKFRRAAGAGVVQVARTGAANWVLPWAVMYEYPLVEADPAKVRWCDVLAEWGEDGVRTGPLRTACPHAGEAWHQMDVICPYGFWGLAHRVEQPLGALLADDDRDPPGTTDKVKCGAEIDLVAAVTEELDDDSLKAAEAHLNRLSGLAKVRYAPPPADDWPGVQKILAQPEVVYFLCHGRYDEATADGYLGIGRGDADPNRRVYANKLSGWLRTQPPDVWLDRRPLVVVNGCHTFELEPGRLLNFVSTFGFAGAAGVIGTEISVQLPVAIEAADLLLGALVRGAAADDALREMRWALADKGNLLGLAYTMYALAGLKLLVDA
ncbi:MAG TPA: CHAT domain-containing protein [Longimicrobium sp.]